MQRMNKELKPLDLTHLSPESQGKWVVLAEDTLSVVATAATPREALELAQMKGCKNPLLHKVQPFDRGFISVVQ